MRSKIAGLIVGLALAVVASGVARANVIAGPTLTFISSSTVTGSEFNAVDNSTLTAFTYQNQGKADTVVLTDTLGNILDSVSIPISTPSDTVSVNWSLTSGNSYWLLQTGGANGEFEPFGTTLPSNADIAITVSGVFASSIAGAIAGTGNADWLDFNNITTTTVATGATPLPAALPLFASGLGAMGLFGWRRKRKNAAALAA